jgi:5'(3')-deoxyribonucleotidase
MTAREFWDGLTSDVWANLEWHDDGREILSVVERFFPPENICILTSPTSNGASAKGKIQWIQKNMPKYRRKYLIGPCKHFCAGKNSILIDDGNHNIDAFRGAGGLTVLVPRKWNSDHALDGHAASCVAEQLGMLERTFDERFSQ